MFFYQHADGQLFRARMQTYIIKRAVHFQAISYGQDSAKEIPTSHSVCNSIYVNSRFGLGEVNGFMHARGRIYLII